MLACNWSQVSFRVHIRMRLNAWHGSVTSEAWDLSNSVFVVAETERALWFLGHISWQTRLVHQPIWRQTGLPHMDDGSLCGARPSRLYPHLHGDADHNVSLASTETCTFSFVFFFLLNYNPLITQWIYFLLFFRGNIFHHKSNHSDHL